ncbi:MAG: riboflavin synthase [Bacteriovoracia bacterium]
MFTGIVEALGTVTQVERGADFTRVTLSTGWEDLALGESVALNGVCLTVAAGSSPSHTLFFVSPETLAKTNLGELTSGTRVNLERALALGARLSGHWVQGHVDGVAHFQGADKDAESYRITVELPAELSRYCVEKGSICLDGVSLTLNQVAPPRGNAFSVGITLIPHTWEHTRFHAMKPGDPINVEVDVLAKYVAKNMEILCRN